MKWLALFIALTFSIPARALVKSHGFSLDIDMQLGGQGQMNPETDYPEWITECCPAKVYQARVPYYQHTQYYTWTGSFGFYAKYSLPQYSKYGASAQADLRLVTAYVMDHFEFKLIELARMSVQAESLPKFSFTLDNPHRSVALQQLGSISTPYFDRYKSSGPHYVVTDQIWAKWAPFSYVELLAGRQPINLSTNYYFSPNDVFAPFAPNDFLRQYKEGEDAIRLSVSPAPLVQMELIAVAGYEKFYWFSSDGYAHFQEEKFAPEFDKRKAALLGHLASSAGTLGVGAVFGWEATRELVGLSLEKDLGSGTMLGFEGNASEYDDDPGRPWIDASFSLSAQLSAAWTARLEFASNPSFPVCPYCRDLEREQRSLNALGLTWNPGGLWQGGVVNLSDLDRWEGLLSWNAQRSMSDNADLIVGGGIPWRLPKERPGTATYFELAPLSINLQLRWVL